MSGILPQQNVKVIPDHENNIPRMKSFFHFTHLTQSCNHFIMTYLVQIQIIYIFETQNYFEGNAHIRKLV